MIHGRVHFCEYLLCLLDLLIVCFMVLCRSYKAEEKKQGSLMQEIIERPLREITVGLKRGTYDKLDDDGIAPPGTRVSGTVAFVQSQDRPRWNDTSCLAWSLRAPDTWWSQWHKMVIWEELKSVGR